MATPLSQNYDAYLSMDLSGYVGMWIAIFEKKIIASGSNPKEVYQKAMELSQNRRVMIARVPPSGLVEML